jgi:nucleotide-binding universal stress UspA family protein
LKGAKPVLSRAKVAFTEKVLVGDPAPKILKFIKSSKCDLLVMGSRGLGAFKNLVLGSVATKILSKCDVPVTLVR